MEDWKYQMLLEVDDEERALCIDRFPMNHYCILAICILSTNWQFAYSLPSSHQPKHPGLDPKQSVIWFWQRKKVGESTPSAKQPMGVSGLQNSYPGEYYCRSRSLSCHHIFARSDCLAMLITWSKWPVETSLDPVWQCQVKVWPASTFRCDFEWQSRLLLMGQRDKVLLVFKTFYLDRTQLSWWRIIVKYKPWLSRLNSGSLYIIVKCIMLTLIVKVEQWRLEQLPEITSEGIAANFLFNGRCGTCILYI